MKLAELTKRWTDFATSINTLAIKVGETIAAFYETAQTFTELVKVTEPPKGPLQ